MSGEHNIKDMSAEELKNKGNISFKNKKYQEAIDWYTKAIEKEENAIYYSNRSICHFKMENYGVALSDAMKSVEVDPKYAKGYFRRGEAHLSLFKYPEAVKDFKMVCKLKPNDKISKDRLKACQKEKRRIDFEKAIRTEQSMSFSETLDLDKMVVEDSYEGARMDESGLTLDFIKGMIEQFRDQKPVHKKYIYYIMKEALKEFKKLNSLFYVDMNDDECITVCGDTHGQYYDVLHIFEMNGIPSKENPYLFNGDFVDRGSFSLEIIITFFAFKVLYPNHFHLTRGNHESRHLNRAYGFESEVNAKLGSDSFEFFQEIFNFLPLAAVLNRKVFVCHGGLFQKDGIKLEDIEKVRRVRDIPENGIMCDLLWADPQDEEGRKANKRGTSVEFGPDVTTRFLEDNNLELIVRSHEVKQEGYEIKHNGKLITVFSAPNYCDSVGNKGAYIKFKGKEMKPDIVQFNAVPHPKVKSYIPSLYKM